MDVGQMNAEQVAEGLARTDGGWLAVLVVDENAGDTGPAKEMLIRQEAELHARQAVVGKPLRGVSLDVAMASDRDSLRQALQGVLAFFESDDFECGESLDRGPVREALRRSDELGAKWEPREVEAAQLAKDLEVARFSATVAHEALRRIVEARDADGHSEDGECAACTAFESAIAAAREIVGGAS